MGPREIYRRGVRICFQGDNRLSAYGCKFGELLLGHAESFAVEPNANSWFYRMILLDWILRGQYSSVEF